MQYILAIDLGTTGCRSMVFDTALNLLGADYEEYGLQTPKPDWYEQDAQLWWDLSKKTMKAAIKASGIDSTQVRAISVSSQGISIVPVDGELKPLRPSLNWMDVRAKDEVRQLTQELGQRETFTRTGKRIDAAYTLPKLLWLQKHEPEIWSKTAKLLMPLDFLTAKLTGQAVTDHSMASGTLLFDIQREVWDSATLDRYHIPESMLPEVRRSGSPVGPVLPAVAAELGLSEDCLVAVGAQDQRCASLGAGLAPGVMTVSLGTAGAICKLWDRCLTEGPMDVGWSSYVFPNSWVTEGVVNTAGASLRWLRDIFFEGKGYGEIDKAASHAQTRDSRLLFLPYMNGPGCPRFDEEATGCFYGASMATEKGDFALAVLEGVAFQTRSILRAMDAYGNVHKLILFGGGAKSPLWSQIFADITEMDVAVPESAEAAGVGAALLAGLGAGIFDRDSLPTLPIAQTYTPSARAAVCRKKYEEFLQLENRLWHHEVK